MVEPGRQENSGPTLSVLMANYDHAQYISEALEAILTQSFRPLEVIVVDDASTDNSVAVIEEFVRRDPIVRLLRNERNMGVVLTINRALREASGDYVINTAADDKVLPGLFEKSMKLLERYPQAAVCWALSRKISEEGKDLGLTHLGPSNCRTECFLPPAKALAAYRRHGFLGEGNTTIYRRDALIEAGGLKPELRSYSDSFVIQVLALKHGACYIPEPLGMRRAAHNSFSSQDWSSELFLDRMKHVVQLMRSNYRDVFPEQYVREFWKQSLYGADVCAISKLQLHQRECLADLERSLEDSRLIDRLFFSGLRFCMAIEYSFVRLYLSFRLRRFTWLYLLRKIELILK